MIVIPTGEKRLREGIEKIREIFEKYSSVSLLSSYFLSIQNFIRMMNKIIIDQDDDFDLDDIVEIAVTTSSNYYDRKIEAGYEGGIILKGEVGYNPFFYAANFVEELVILDHYIDQGDNFIAVFPFLNPYELFYQFRMMYDYGDDNKVTNRITYERFKTILLPQPKESRLPKIYLPSDYSNVVDYVEGKSLLVKEKEIEEIFNGMLIDYIKENFRENYTSQTLDIYDMAKKYIEGGSEVRRKDVYKGIKQKDIFTELMGINKYFEYGLIKIKDEMIVKDVFVERKFIVVDNHNVISLLHLDKEEKVVTHYYSEKNQKISDFYTERGYEYKLNFDYGINNCCKVVDSCVLFIIFYNNFRNEEKFNMMCVSEETNFIIFLSLFL
jgi:hypothetical protein